MTQDLVYSQVGNGPSLVFLHGWGANAAIWINVVKYFKNDYCVRCLDLPGYGANQTVEQPDFYEAAALLAEQIPADSVVVAWSLSGLLALYLADSCKDRIKQLILVGSSPCFVKRPDWPCGVDEAVFSHFSRQLKNNHATTLARFLSLQTRGSKQAASTLKALRSACFSSVSPSQSTLDAGLDWLCDQDLRSTLAQLAIPVSCIFGQYDTIVSPDTGMFLQQLNPLLECRVISSAAHVPFISHCLEFCSLVQNYLEDCQQTEKNSFYDQQE